MQGSSLLVLPSELLIQIARIVSQTIPDDIESFAASSGRLQQICRPVIEEHRQLQKAYATVITSGEGAARLISAIARKPWVAYYPQSLELRCSPVSAPRVSNLAHRTGSVARITAHPHSQSADEDLEDLLRRTGLIEADQEKRWIQHIRTSEEDHLFALLLACLPNVRRLAIRLEGNQLGAVKDMARLLKSTWSRHEALLQLRTLCIWDRSCDSRSGLELLPILASLPGVQKIYATNLAGMMRDCYKGDWFSYPGMSSSITHVSLETCGISNEALEQLMRSLKNLRSFRHIHHRPGWPLTNIAKTLKSATDSLETLDLSAGSGSVQFIGPLKSFGKLKHLTIDTDMLVSGGRMQRFVDMMPASIETCTIAGNNLTRPLEQTFLAELYRISFHYPCLKNIWAEDSWGRRKIGQDRLKFQKEYHKQSESRQRHK